MTHLAIESLLNAMVSEMEEDYRTNLKMSMLGQCWNRDSVENGTVLEWG